MRSLKERENQIELRHAGIHASKEKYLVGAPVLTKMDEFSEILIADKTENVEQKVLKKSAAYFPKKRGGQRPFRVSPKIHPFLWGRASFSPIGSDRIAVVVFYMAFWLGLG